MRLRHYQIVGWGKRKRIYRAEDYHTPYEKLVSLADWDQHLKPGITVALLRQQTTRHSDTEATELMQKAKAVLLAKVRTSR